MEEPGFEAYPLETAWVIYEAHAHRCAREIEKARVFAARAPSACEELRARKFHINTSEIHNVLRKVFVRHGFE